MRFEVPDLSSIWDSSSLMCCTRKFAHLRISLGKSFHTTTSVNALSALAQPKAERISANWKGTSATGGRTKNFIGGQFAESKATEWIDVHDPVSTKQTYGF